jgi:hypothetical protein
VAENMVMRAKGLFEGTMKEETGKSIIMDKDKCEVHLISRHKGTDGK